MTNPCNIEKPSAECLREIASVKDDILTAIDAKLEANREILSETLLLRLTNLILEREAQTNKQISDLSHAIDDINGQIKLLWQFKDSVTGANERVAKIEGAEDNNWKWLMLGATLIAGAFGALATLLVTL